MMGNEQGAPEAIAHYPPSEPVSNETAVKLQPGVTQQEPDSEKSQEGQVKDGASSHITETEASPEDEEANRPMSSYGDLFRFATSWDIVCMLSGLFGTVLVGVMQPLSIVLFGDLVDASGAGEPDEVAHYHASE